VSRITYLDHAATTPLREEVRDAMLPHLSGLSGNPSSIHAPGRRASAALREARERVASALGAQPEEIVFTRGGTESDNLAVLGRAAVARREGRPPVVAHSAIEHSAVLEACCQVEDDGGIRLRLPVTSDGSLDDGALDAAIAHAPDVLSVMWVNNETGTILPVPEVARRASSEGVVLHSDAVQAIGKVPVDVDRVPVSLLTITGHKIGGPRGTGVLFVRRGTELRPVFHGGGQERGLRPGTEDLAGAVGMAEAVSLAVEEQAAEAERLGALRERLEARLRDALPGLRVYGADAPRAPHVLAVGLADCSQELLLAGLDMEGVACSGGSACHSGAAGGEGAASSHVLRALAPDGVRGRAALRFSLGRETTASGVDDAVRATRTVVERLGGLQPEAARG